MFVVKLLLIYSFLLNSMLWNGNERETYKFRNGLVLLWCLTSEIPVGFVRVWSCPSLWSLSFIPSLIVLIGIPWSHRILIWWCFTLFSTWTSNKCKFKCRLFIDMMYKIFGKCEYIDWLQYQGYIWKVRSFFLLNHTYILYK